MKKKVFITVLFLVTTLFSHALNSVNKDSLYIAFMLLKDDSSKVKKAINIGADLGDKGYHKEGIKYLIIAEEISMKINFNRYLLIMYRILGLLNMYSGELENSLKYQNKALLLSIEKGDSLSILNLYTELATTYAKKFEFQKAFELHLKSLKIAEKINYKPSIAAVYGNLASLYIYQENYSQAIENQLKCLKIYKELNQPSQIAKAFNNIGVIYSRLNNNPKSLEYHIESLKIREKLSDKKDLLTSLSNIAEAYFFLNDYQKSEKYGLESLKFSEEIENKSYILSSHLILGRVYLKTNNIKKADHHLENALQLAGTIQEKNLLKDLYDLLSEVNENKQDFKSSLKYYKLHKLLADSIFKDNMNQKIVETSIKYETERKDNEIKLLNKEKEIKEAELIQKNIDHRNILLASSTLAVLIMLIGFLYFQINKQKQQSSFYKLEHEKTIADLNFLKAQIAPHVIFNTINAIYIQLDDNIEKGRENLLKFSQVMRYQLYDCNEPFIEIGKEIEHIYNYIDLHKLRKSENCSVSIKIQEDLEGFKIAPLIFIPLIENAFKYLSNFKDAENFIKINLKKEGNKLIFNCANTFIQKDNDSNTNFKYGGIGHVNLKRRLELIYPNKYYLNFHTDKPIFKTELIIDAE